MELVGETAAWLTDPAHWQGSAGIPTRLLEHVAISLAALVLAVAIALPAGLFVGHTRRGAALVINVANIGRALPTLALITLILPITSALDPQLGFKVYPTVLALVVLGLPPILVNTYVSVSGVDADLIEAARGMGLREREVLRRVEIPVAVPAIAGGIRSAASQIVATATLGALFGGAGLGRYLVEGLAQRDYAMMFAGVTVVALLSLGTEGLFALVQRRVTSPGLVDTGTRSRFGVRMPGARRTA